MKCVDGTATTMPSQPDLIVCMQTAAQVKTQLGALLEKLVERAHAVEGGAARASPDDAAGPEARAAEAAALAEPFDIAAAPVLPAMNTSIASNSAIPEETFAAWSVQSSPRHSCSGALSPPRSPSASLQGGNVGATASSPAGSVCGGSVASSTNSPSASWQGGADVAFAADMPMTGLRVRVPTSSAHGSKRMSLRAAAPTESAGADEQV